MAFVYGTDNIILYGGFYTSFLNDTWRYEHYSSPRNGTYISPPLDIGENSSIKNIIWHATLEKDTSIQFQIRSAAKNNDLLVSAFLGPNGSKEEFYTYPYSDIWDGHGGDRWVQYKAYLRTTLNQKTPVLKDITLIYNHWPTAVPELPKNDEVLTHNFPVFNWSFIDSDSPYQTGFQIVIDDNIVSAHNRNTVYIPVLKFTVFYHIKGPLVTVFLCNEFIGVFSAEGGKFSVSGLYALRRCIGGWRFVRQRNCFSLNRNGLR